MDAPIHSRGSQDPFLGPTCWGLWTRAPIGVLSGAHKHFAHVLCLGLHGGVVKDKLNSLHSDPGNITSWLSDLGDNFHEPHLLFYEMELIRSLLWG